MLEHRVNESVEEAYRRLVKRGFARILRYKNTVLALEAIEPRHDLRSEIRRFEALINLFQSFLDPQGIHKPVRRIQKLRKEVGKVRDLDLAIELLRSWKKLHEAEIAPRVELDDAIDCLLERRNKELEHLQEFIELLKDADAHRKLERGFLRAVQDSASKPLTLFGHQMLDPLVKDFESHSKALQEYLMSGKKYSAKEWHPVRIAGRGLRYALESEGFSIAELSMTMQEELRKQLRVLQTDAGNMLDRSGQIELLRPLLNGPSVYSRHEHEPWEVQLREERSAAELLAKKDVTRLLDILHAIEKLNQNVQFPSLG
jgi:CHAD domain-containing protein